jgi:nucleoside-specific outer membrane channel protein Tsx
MEPLPETYRNSRGAYAIDPSIKWVKTVTVQDNGFTNIVGFKAIWDWQNSLRPDVARTYGDWDCEWAKQQSLAEQDYEANAAKYIAEALGKGAGNA